MAKEKKMTEDNLLTCLLMPQVNTVGLNLAELFMRHVYKIWE